MATSRTPRRTAAAPAAPTRASRRRTEAPASPAVDLTMAKRKFAIEYLDITDIIPYEYNPRDNEKAIPAVAESIRNFGFLIPCVVDANNVLVAGHTRTEAAKLLGLTEVPCVRATDLTPEQVNQFRLIDNKVAEQARWDFDLLAGEMAKLGDVGLDWTAFGWTQEEVDCLSDVVQAECLDATTLTATATQASASHQARRAPQQARFVLGEIVFFIPIEVYRAWADGVRQLHDFDEDAITADIKRRLNILE